ncbi:Surfeit locus protein 2 (SURF2 [Striga hermonthica]|uniref:Surfeit locus protein 2 (SURF2) n=1 Tax=Striga hermonthica TaxID=68872 RepID=A0A9N7N2D8_STRHE|nr:Surfeit locus protein 2 (SURF2 [Striga hermonthica]
MGKKRGEESPNPSELKEGHNLLGAPTFEQLENGRLKCVETGHELPRHARDSYADSKHCRLGLIDAALARNKPPLNMFKQDPAARSKLICRLTGDTINKTEEHIWKHINGKRFLNMLDKKEAEKEAPNGKTEKQEEKKKEKKKIEYGCLKKNKKKMEEEIENIDDIINEVRDPAGNGSDSEEDEADFWMPPAGERWDHDDGGNRWGSDSESGPGAEDDENDDDDMGAEEDKIGTAEISKRTKRMSLEIGPSSFASRKKKKKTDVA